MTFQFALLVNMIYAFPVVAKVCRWTITLQDWIGMDSELFVGLFVRVG
jgi:hypothetical protein